jgi:hypothetical protein
MPVMNLIPFGINDSNKIQILRISASFLGLRFRRIEFATPIVALAPAHLILLDLEDIGANAPGLAVGTASVGSMPKASLLGLLLFHHCFKLMAVRGDINDGK